MISLKKDLKRNEGFTLVELMIVISIIAILAVVLVPRVNTLRGSAKEQGVVSNITSLRAYLELEIDNMESAVGTEASRLITELERDFEDGTDYAIVNPFTGGDEIADWSGDNFDDQDVSVIVEAEADDIDDALTEDRYFVTQRDESEGMVVIVVCPDGYFVYGYDINGYALPDYQIVRQ